MCGYVFCVSADPDTRHGDSCLGGLFELILPKKPPGEVLTLRLRPWWCPSLSTNSVSFMLAF